MLNDGVHGEGGGGAPPATSTASGGSTGGGGAADGGSSGHAVACSEGFIRVEGDGPTHELVFSCLGWGSNGSQGPAGYFAHPRPPPKTVGGQLLIEGCSSADAAPPRLLTQADVQGTGSYHEGTAAYDDDDGVQWLTPTPDLLLELTAFGAVGEDIEGSLQATVALGNETKLLSVAFRVCHTPDVYYP